jgi:hypothetical protein
MEQATAFIIDAPEFVRRFSVPFLLPGRQGFPALRTLVRAISLLNISVDIYSGRPGYFLRVGNGAIPAEGTSVADLTSVIHAAVFKILYVVAVPHIDMVAVHLLGSMTSSTGFVAAVDPNTMLCPVSLFINQRVATISLVVLQQIGCPIFPGDKLIGDVPDIVVLPIVNPVIPPAVDVVIPPIVF